MFRLKNKLNSEIFKSALDGKDITTYGGKAIKQQLKRILIRLYLEYEKDEGYQHSSDEVERRASKIIEHYSPTIMEVVSGSYNYIKYGSIVVPQGVESAKSEPGKDSSMSSSEQTGVEKDLEELMGSGPPKEKKEVRQEKQSEESVQSSKVDVKSDDFGLEM